MYYYIIKSAKTGKVIAEGTAGQLSRAGLYSTPDSVRTAYNEWRRRTERGLKTSKMWTRKGEPGQAPLLPQGTGKNAPTALQLDCYELERLNWRRRQEGKPALSYGIWASLGKPKA